MSFRINVNSLKNAMGTVFLLAAAFFVCSTFISMRSVFADPIAPANTLPQRGRVSPRATTQSRANSARTTTSRPAVSRASTTSATASRSATSRGSSTNRIISPRGTGSMRNVSANSASTRAVVSRNKNTASARVNTSNRAVRARTASGTPSRVSATGAVMAGNRASTTTSYSYLASSLYTGSYSNIIDSTTGLISADAYSNCLESYYTCMDEICTARNDTKGRCSCAGRATNFLEAETLLETANEELIKLSGQLSLLIATKGKGDDLAAAFSLTDAEKVMNCVSYQEATDKKEWCESHPQYTDKGVKIETCAMPDYCKSTGNNFGFDIKNIDGSGSDILAQLKSWANAKDLAADYTSDNPDDLWLKYTTISGVVNANVGITTDVDSNTVSIDKLANKWGYDLFQYAHNNVCGRVLDSCFNGIYEACGNPKSITEEGTTVRIKCANGATSNCPFNYNSYISVNTDTGDVELSDRSDSSNVSVNSSASCFGYSGSSTTTTSRSGITTTSTDPYATLRGPVADARRSIMQKYLLDANAACDAYGSALKQTAQNINYQKIAAEQALQQKRLEFKQQEEATMLADAATAIDNFNECVSEIWDCYEEYSNDNSDDTRWTTARIKAYCSQMSQVPHCYEPMICSPLQSQLVAVVDKPDSKQCVYSNEYAENNCRNVVTINEILYGTGTPATNELDNWDGVGRVTLNSSAVREQCLQRTLGCSIANAPGDMCLRKWTKKSAKDATGIYSSDGSNSGLVSCSETILRYANAETGYIDGNECILTMCSDGSEPVGNECPNSVSVPSGGELSGGETVD